MGEVVTTVLYVLVRDLNNNLILKSLCNCALLTGSRKHPLVNRQHSTADTLNNQTNYDWETASISTTRNGRRGSVTSSMSMSETSSANSSNGMGCKLKDFSCLVNL